MYPLPRVLVPSLLLVAATNGCSADPVYVGLVPEQATCQPGRCYIADEASPESLIGQFSEPIAGVAPHIVYPLDGVAHPPNLKTLTVQWSRGADQNTMFRLRLGNAEESFDFYVPCFSTGKGPEHGCAYQLPEDVWSAAARHFRGQTVELQIWGRGPEAPLGTSSPIRIRFTPEDAEGAVYYWSRSSSQALRRWVFGSKTSSNFPLPESAGNQNRCAGCHAVSRDGSTLAFTVGDADPSEGIETNAAFNGRLYATLTAKPEPPLIDASASESDSAMMTFTRDGSRVLTAFDQRLVLRNTETGDIEHEVSTDLFAPGERAFFPEFSPDDQQVVVTLAVEQQEPEELPRQFAVRSGRIAVLPFNDGLFGEEPRVIVPEADGLFHYYPTWSPDGNWIAFVSARHDGVRDSYNRADARLRLVSSTGGTIYDLSAASGHTSTWPRFLPYFQCGQGGTECTEGERLYFLSFSSIRDYGYLLKNSTSDWRLLQLWLTAIDLRHLEESGDPSHPPLWLPHQDLGTSNHSAAWTERAACTKTSQCASGERCSKGACRVVDKP